MEKKVLKCIKCGKIITEEELCNELSILNLDICKKCNKKNNSEAKVVAKIKDDDEQYLI